MERAGVRPVNVLMVEDDLVHAKLMRRALRGFDRMRIVHVEDGEAAIDAVSSRHEIDLVLLDLRLPGRDGFEVLESIRAGERTRSIPVVIVSTSDRIDEMERCYALGANAFLCKPVGFEEMTAAVRAMTSFWIDIMGQSQFSACDRR